MLYRLYDCVNGEWWSEQLFTRDDAEAYLLRHQDDEAFREGDVHFVPADSDGDYDGDLIELRDLIKDLA